MSREIFHLADTYNSLLGINIKEIINNLLDGIFIDEEISSSFLQSKQKGNEPCVEISLLTNHELIDIEILKDSNVICILPLRNIKNINCDVNNERVRVLAKVSDGQSFVYDAHSPTKQIELKDFYRILIKKWRAKNA